LGVLGIDAAALSGERGPAVRSCMDWTERRGHVAGGLGAALTDALAGHGWIRRRGDSRIVTVTPPGDEGLRGWLGIDLAALRPAA
ncbi:MAG: transcriptional regulator, partial [Trebonia sp.]